MDKEEQEEFELRYRAANLAILSKVFVGMGGSADDFANLMEISQPSIKKMRALDDTAGEKWDYESIAEKLDMDPDVFSGKYLIKVQTPDLMELCLNLRTEDNKPYNEKMLWNTILDYKYKEDGDDDEIIRHNGKRLQTMVLNELAKQVKEEHFQDLQLWKFWDYIRKNMMKEKKR